MDLEIKIEEAKRTITAYVLKLEEQFQDPKFRQILIYFICGVEEIDNETELAAAVENITYKLNEVRDICKVREEAIVAIRCYAVGLSVDLAEAEKVIVNTKERMDLLYDRNEILTIRDGCMEKLRIIRKGPNR